MGGQRTSFSKLQRDRDKKAKAAAKREKRQERSANPDGGDVDVERQRPAPCRTVAVVHGGARDEVRLEDGFVNHRQRDEDRGRSDRQLHARFERQRYGYGRP